MLEAAYLNILGTSGDTGSAAIAGVRQEKHQYLYNVS